MSIKDFVRGIYSEGLAYNVGEPGELMMGVAPGPIIKPVLLDATGAIIINASGPGGLPTYMCAFSLAAVAGHSVEVLGSATKTVVITEVFLTKPTAPINVSILKLSVADTAGTSSNGTRVPLASTNPTVTAVVKLYTVAPTPGTIVGSVYADNLQVSEKVNVIFNNGQPMTLIGVAQSMVITVDASATLVGYVKWQEF